MKHQILYLFDPLCGWCYGFSQTMLEFYHQHKDQFEVVAIPGGMITDERVKPASSMHAYISGAYERVETTSGVRFGEAYLKQLIPSDSIMLNSEPPSRALLTFRSFHFERAVEFAHALQEQHFAHGRDYNDESLYSDLAVSFQIDPEAFMTRYYDERMKQNVQQEFAWVRESGVQGFPTVVYRSDQKYFMLAHGYMPLDQLNLALERARVVI